jgi:hypothetical protein
MSLSRFVLILMFLAIVVYASLAVFMRPLADDYCLIANGIEKGPIQAALDIYYSWSGRYTTYFFVGWQGVLGNWSLILFPILVIIGFCLIWFRLTYQIANLLKLKNPVEIASYGGIFFGLCFVDSVSAEPIFWPSAMSSYALPALIVLLHLSSFLTLLEDEAKGLRLWLISCVWGFVLLFAAGFSETYVAFHGLSLSLAWGFAFFFLCGNVKRITLSFFSTSLLGLSIGALIVLNAPGAEVRLSSTLGVEEVSVSNKLPFIIWNLFAYPLIDRYGTAITILVFITTIFFLLYWYRDDADAFLGLKFNRYVTAKVFWLSLFAFFLVNSITIILPVLGTGWLVSRTWILPRVLQFGMAIFWAVLVTDYLLRSGSLKRLRGKMLLTLTVRGISAILLLYPIILIVRNVSLAQDFALFAQEWDARDAYVREAAKTQEVVTAPPLDHNMEVYMNLLIAGTESNWVNDCMEIYYGLEQYEVSGEGDS